MQRKFGEVAVVLVLLIVGDLKNSRVGKTSDPNEKVVQYGEVTNNKNGEDMLKLLKNNMNDRAKKSGPERTRQCVQKGESSILDFMVVENASSQETEAHACAAETQELRINA